MSSRVVTLNILVGGLIFLQNVGKVEPTAGILTDIAKGFAKGLNQCKKEIKLPETILEDLYNFWKGDYDMEKGKDLGCAIICMSKKLDLLNEDSKMHHGNAFDFAKKHGADDAMAKQIVEMIHDCEKPHDAIEDHCERVLHIAKCFKEKIANLSWTPNMEEVLEQVIADTTQ